MEFLDPVKRKKNSRKLFFGYGLLSILVGLATYVLVATAVGYEIFNTSGEVVQNGLVFVASEPVPATITVDGKVENERTEARLPLPAGEYTITLNEPGYTSWTKKITVEGGNVQFLSYPRLYPTQLNPIKRAELPGATGLTSQSPDQRWLVVQQNSTVPTLTIFDLNRKPLTSIQSVIPSAILAGSPGAYGSFTVLEWADNNRHFLMRQNVPDGSVRFLLIDRQEIENSRDIGTVFSSSAETVETVYPTRVSLRNKKFDRYYLYYGVGGVLRTGNLDSATPSEPIVDQVLAYESSGNDLIVYATTRDSVSGKVAVKIRDGAEEMLLGETVFDASSNYFLGVSRYNGAWYYAVGSGQSDRLSIYKNPWNYFGQAQKPPLSAVTRAGIPNLLEPSPKFRFFVTRSGNKFSVYDNRDDKSYTFESPLPLDAGSEVSWMDEFHLQIVSGGKIAVFEFDGTNVRSLTSVNGIAPGFFSREYETLFSISPSGDSQALYETSLRLSRD